MIVQKSNRRGAALNASIFGFCLSAILANTPEAATVTTPVLDLQSSNASVIIRSNADAPNDEEKRDDPNFASAQRVDLGGFASGNTGTGELKLSTATNGLRNLTLNPLNINNTADVTLKYVFVNPGLSDFTIKPGALSYAIDGSFQRSYVDPNSVGLGTQRFTTGLLGTLAMFGATSGSGGVNVEAVGNASELTIGADPNVTPNTPNSSIGNVLSDFTQADGDGVLAVIANKDAIVVGGGKTLTITASLRGKASTLFGPNPTNCSGTNAVICDVAPADLSLIGASVDALNTGRLKLTVPEGTVISGFASSPTWITTENPPSPIPLPASLGMMLTVLAGIGLARVRRKAS